MKRHKIDPTEISLNQSVLYRAPNLGRVGEELIPALIVEIERSTKGMVTTVRLQSKLSNRFYTTVPSNLFVF
jgi:hypothetical protein